MQEREKIIVRTSIVGIVANIVLVAFKAIIGLMANSIAIVLDAVNNLTDAISSVVTIVGTKLASRKPDKNHPLGHGRIEFISTLIVAGLVLYAGITALIESIQGIINPEEPDYKTVGLIIIGVAVVVKLFLGVFYRKRGKKVNSGVLVASGTDALFDAVISIGVLASAIVYITTGLSLEAYVGVVISLVIIKAGIDMVQEALNEILGKRLDRDYLKEIRDTICEEENVRGAYDLILHNYGPDRYIGSVHVEIPDTLTAEEIDELGRRIEERVYVKHGVILAGVGIYSVNTSDDDIVELRRDVTHRINNHEGVIQMHGFHVDKERKRVFMDLIMDYDLKDHQERFFKICEELKQAHPEYEWMLTQDIDF